MSSNQTDLKKKLALTNQIILNTREINLNEFQVHVNWEIFNIKYLVLMFAHLVKTSLESSTLCNTSVVLH